MTLVIWSACIGGSPTSTAMMTSAPMDRATSTGKLSEMKPSTSSSPSRETGAKPPGTAMLANTALEISPSPITTAWPVTISVATARNGSA